MTTERRSNRLTDVSMLKVAHEEADTRILLHAANSSCDTVVVSDRDTDVFIMLLSHPNQVRCKQLWMMAGTYKKRRFIPIHAIHCKLLHEVLSSLLAFHAISGCDTTYISGQTKRSMWKTFIESTKLLRNLARGPLTQD